MKKTWIWIALAASVALNAFFVGGYVQANLQADQSSTRAGLREIIDRRVGLTDEQRDELRATRKRVRAEVRQVFRDGQDSRDEFWDELAKPEPDNAAIDRLTAQAAERRIALAGRITGEIRAFLDQLDPEQREEFVAILRNRPLLGGRFLMEGGRPFRGPRPPRN